jgi:hypothetical protein
MAQFDEAFFRMAIDHCWRASNATSVLDGLGQLAVGLQQFIAGMNRALNLKGQDAKFLTMAIDHCWRASNATSELEALGQLAVGLQQFVAGMKGNLSG